MAGNKSKSPNKREMRNLRIQQFIFIAIGVDGHSIDDYFAGRKVIRLVQERIYEF